MIEDTLKRITLYGSAIPYIEEVKNVIDKLDSNMEIGTYTTDNPDLWYSIQCAAGAGEEKLFEVHEQCIDIHIVLSGKERIDYLPYEEELPPDFKAEDDCALYSKTEFTSTLLTPGIFLLLFPKEGHRPLMKADDSLIRKAVIKIRQKKH